MGDFLDFPDVQQEIRGAMNNGRLKLQNSSIIFKNMKTGKVDQLASADIEKVQWLQRARGHCLKVALNSGNIHRFDGFKESDFDKLSSFVEKNYDVTMEKKDVSYRGWNWGTVNFEGNTLDFIVENKSAFELPLGNVSHCATAKSEVTIEFHQNDDAAVSLMELRFHIPPDANPENDPVQDFYTSVMSKADIIQATGDAICTFNEVQCLTPRGRYDIKLYPTFLQLHGKTFDYKIPYTTILRLFLLPHRDGRQKFFVVSLDPPIKQGQTRYHFVILLFNTDDEITLEMGLSEDDIQEKYEGKLNKVMSGPEYEIISRIMKTLVQRKITVPGSFIGNTGTHSIACSYKAATGFLYPLERGFIFVHKPPVHIRFDEVGTVNFARSSGNTRSFDFDVETKMGTQYTFSSMEKDEYGKLYDFVTNKKLRVKNIGGKLDKVKYNEDMSGSDEDDHDAYMERMKAEGKEKDEDFQLDEDDDESEDEDFEPNLDMSEPDDEFDSNISSTDSSNDDDDDSSESSKKSKKPKKEKKEKKKRTVPEGKKRKKKVKGDPNKPKRPQSAYFLWLNEMREEIKAENPDAGVTDIAKLAGQRWKEVTDKTRWEGLAVKAKESYEKAMEEYLANKSDSDSDGEKASSPKKKKKSKPSASSPLKELKGGSGAGFKSKEFISDSDSNAVASDGDGSSESSDSDKPLKRRESKRRAGGEASEPEDLPDEEEILSSPAHSEPDAQSAGSSEDEN
ncbi:hypothetical protein CAPTEDRAFT_172235 [Capitella teleta]|uniref:FACT complex subunit SSRP1 n=1 Tax=Capitella teleta TaxID=283909 RepID=X1ZCN8_CAPTE|nr:hypothetical protein CAPTEDRAFT_172235 [Capitella teleta]|eukprot:ELT88434.1 hypothetical protein CAPTEDRAFT_172235 [Capitella teleta]